MTAPLALGLLDQVTGNAGNVHWYCCDPDRALCGVDLTGTPEVSTAVAVDCLNCHYLVPDACPDCGEERTAA